MGIPGAPAVAQAARRGQGHTLQGHYGQAMLVEEVYVGHQATAWCCLPHPGVGILDFVLTGKSLEHKGFHADRQMWFFIRDKHQQCLQTGIQDTGVQPVGTVAVIPGRQKGQRFSFAVHQFVDMTELGAVIKPHFGGQFVESTARGTPVATRTDGFQIDPFGITVHAGPDGSRVRQPRRPVVLGFRPG